MWRSLACQLIPLGFALLTGLTIPAIATGTSSESATFRHEIQPGKLAEECRKLAAGEHVRYRFKAAATVDFNVHFHRGDAVEYPLRKHGIVEDASTFVAPSAQEFCWMWSNGRAAPVVVQGEIVRVK